jgi:hypothetical protein
MPASRPAVAAGAKADLLPHDFDPSIEWQGPGVVSMAFGEIAGFILDFGRRTVTLAAVHPDADQATIDHFLDDHVAPRVLAADGSLVLHGSATLIGSRIAVFLGVTG